MIYIQAPEWFWAVLCLWLLLSTISTGLDIYTFWIAKRRLWEEQ